MVLNDFRHLRPLLQISPTRQEEHSDSFYALFKCLNCHNTFEIFMEDTWSFCPKCGNNAGTVKQDIKRKKYYDNVGCLKQINGKWVHVKAPVFSIVLEFFFDGAWEEYAYGVKTGPHEEIKHELKRLQKRDRFRLIPSLPLNLP